MSPRTIGVVGGYWSTNIGNSFFQLGAEYILRRMFPRDRVVMLGDQPGYWNVRRGNPANALIVLEHMALDYLVILGPFLRPEYDRILLQTLRALHRKGVRLIVLSAGMMDYRPEVVRQCREWLAETPPFIFTTRDSETYHNFADLAEHAYDGIDAAFFVSDLFPPLPLTLDPYVVFNFDQIPEPAISITPLPGQPAPADYTFAFQDRTWALRFPRLRTALSHRLKPYPFLDAFWPQNYPERIGELLVVRTDHRYNPFTLAKGYKAPNSFAADIPHTYLVLYAGAALTLSNRVHACVATLAYGNASMLFSRTPRARLLQRMGLDQLTSQPQRLDLAYLADEKARLLAFLQSCMPPTPLAGRQLPASLEVPVLN